MYLNGINDAFLHELPKNNSNVTSFNFRLIFKTTRL